MMGGATLVLAASMASLLQYALLPVMYTFDLLFITAVYLSLFSDRERTVFLVWALGIVRGIMSSEASLARPMFGPTGVNYAFYPLFFVFIYMIVGLVRSKVRSRHPFTQFMIIFILAVPYGFFDILFNAGGSVSQRALMYWPGIGLVALLNGLAAILVFRLLSGIPVKVVLESERRGF